MFAHVSLHRFGASLAQTLIDIGPAFRRSKSLNLEQETVAVLYLAGQFIKRRHRFGKQIGFRRHESYSHSFLNGELVKVAAEVGDGLFNAGDSSISLFGR